MTIPTANPIASNIVKPTILPCVKQEVGSTLGATQSALSSITPSPIGNAPALQQVQVPTPVLQPVVQVHKSVPTPVLQHPAAKAATNRTIGRPQGVHPAAMQQQRVVKSPPQPKASKKKKAAVSMATAQSATSSNQGENTGRWTAEEHRLFLQGLEQHGKGWKKIASLIKSRTVVQIRTHAQKYFQKIAKARQNGEEGEVSMENRERVVVSNSHKRKRGTKRKPIASVVASAVRESKKQATATEKMKANTSGSGSSSNDNYVALPEVAPALAPYVYPMGVPQPAPQVDGQITPTESVYSAAVPSITTAHGTISGAALEDSLFRFLTPMPNEVHQSSGQNVNDVARQAGANPITVPSSNKVTQPQYVGEVSPTGVVDFPSNWAWNTQQPEWYAKGADVDELLNEAEALDWLADSGDLTENYVASDHPNSVSEPSLLSLVETEEVKQPPVAHTVPAPPVPVLESSNAMASPLNSAMNMAPLPSLFESGNNLLASASTTGIKKEKSMNLSSTSLFASATEAADAVVDVANFHLLDAQFDEQAFVTALLDQNGDSSSNLNHLDQ